jgi:hypothetical protein
LRRQIRLLRDGLLVLATWNGQPRSPNALSTDWSETMADLGLKTCSEEHDVRATPRRTQKGKGLDGAPAIRGAPILKTKNEVQNKSGAYQRPQ